MDNHIHLIWQALPKNTPEQLQRSFLRFTAQQIKFDLQEHHPKVLEMFYVGAKDRMYQFWERNPLSVDLYSPSVMYQIWNIFTKIQLGLDYAVYLKITTIHQQVFMKLARQNGFG